MFLFGDFQHFYFDEPTTAVNDGSQGDALAERIEQAFTNLADRQGGVDAAGLVLMQENRQYRSQISSLKRQLEEASGKIPAEGAVVLDADQAARWATYQELGEPDALKQTIDGHTKLQRDLLIRDAAAAHDYKAAVLGKLPGFDSAQIEIRETEQDGNKVKVAYVKQGDGQERPLPDYIQSELGDFLPALKADAAAVNGDQGKRTPFPKQTAGGVPANGDRVAAFIERQKSQGGKDEKKPII